MESNCESPKVKWSLVHLTHTNLDEENEVFKIGMGNPGLCVFGIDQEFSMNIWTHVHWVLYINWFYKGTGILMCKYIIWFRNYFLLQIRFRYWSFLRRKLLVQDQLNFHKSIFNLTQHFNYVDFGRGFTWF